MSAAIARSGATSPVPAARARSTSNATARRAERHHDAVRAAPIRPHLVSRSEACVWPRGRPAFVTRGVTIWWSWSSPRQPMRGRLHPQRLLRRARAGRQDPLGSNDAALPADQRGQCQRRHRSARDGGRRVELRGTRGRRSLCRRGGPALLDRRDRRAPAGRSHRRGIAGPARPIGCIGMAAAARHHDHGSGAQAGLAPLRDRRGTASITGIAKGAGMICPDMATMLAFIATDAAVAPDCSRPAWARRSPGRSMPSRSTATPRPTTPACWCDRGLRQSRDPRRRVAGIRRTPVRRRCGLCRAGDRHRARRRGRDQAGDRAGRRRGGCRGGPRGRLHHRPFALGEDGALRVRSQLGPHPGRRRACGSSGSRHRSDPNPPRRRS
jgi:hypothetical protein